jgi:hypothetical protein
MLTGDAIPSPAGNGPRFKFPRLFLFEYNFFLTIENIVVVFQINKVPYLSKLSKITISPPSAVWEYLGSGPAGARFVIQLSSQRRDGVRRSFGFWLFEFVSNFGFRDSDLAARCALFGPAVDLILEGGFYARRTGN